MSEARPVFSIITPVFDPPQHLLARCIESVRAQRFADWELLLIDDGSRDPVIPTLLARAASGDKRVHYLQRAENGGIVAASSDGLAAARADWVVLLDHDDVLLPDALERLAGVIDDDVDYVYSDEAIVTSGGAVLAVHAKPAWSPERLRSQMYCGHLSAFRTALARDVGGFDPESNGSQDYDLVLRVTEQARRVVHIPRVLYHWTQAPGSTALDPEAKLWAYEAAIGAVQRHCDRVGIEAIVERGEHIGVQRLRRKHDDEPLVSVVIPSRGSVLDAWGAVKPAVVQCLSGILERTAWGNLEVIVVLDVDTPVAVREALIQFGGPSLRIVDFDDDFNFSAKCNLGALEAKGDYLIFLNDDTDVITQEWISEMVGFLREPDVGMVGAKLLFADSTIQHAGQAWSGAPGHAFFRVPSAELGPMAGLIVAREASGVTAACAAIRRKLFLEVGGFCERFASNYNDVDLSLKIRESGYRIVWTPYACLWHFESTSRDPAVTEDDTRRLRERWAHRLAADPYLTVGMIEFDPATLPDSR